MLSLANKTRIIPKETVESITLFGRTMLTTACMQECLSTGVPVQYFSSSGRYFGRLLSTGHVHPQRIKQQVYASDNPSFCLEMSKKMVDAKMHNQEVLLRRYQRNSLISVQKDLHQMHSIRMQLPACETVSQVMGHEGIVARHYFHALSLLVDEPFQFKGRSRQPPLDAFNAMLSFGYTLLMYTLYAEIENRGLSPYISFLHSVHPKHPALASDMMEEWRAAVVDSVVMSLVQGHEILIDQFSTQEDTKAVLMDKQAMRIFITKFEKKLMSKSKYLCEQSCSIRRCFYLQSVAMTKAIETQDVAYYTPLQMR